MGIHHGLGHYLPFATLTVSPPQSLSRPKNFRTHTIHPSFHPLEISVVRCLVVAALLLPGAGQPHVERGTDDVSKSGMIGQRECRKYSDIRLI